MEKIATIKDAEKFWLQVLRSRFLSIGKKNHAELQLQRIKAELANYIETDHQEPAP